MTSRYSARRIFSRKRTPIQPCKRIYLAVQLMYMDSPNLARYHQYYWEQVRAVVDVAPSTSELLSKVSNAVLEAHYYPALKAARELVRYEQELVSHALKST
jgi:flagellar biosynthesis repressor protein FlbT